MTHRLFFLVFVTLLYTAIGQDFVYPKNEEPTYLSGNNPLITERIPVYIPNRCPENMILYPGAGEKSTWMCDCRPGFLYFPLNNSCHEAYSQGPCAPGSYVYLPKGEVVPICTENPCSPGERVPFNGKCYTIGSSLEEPCGPSTTLFVNRTTFQLQCNIPALGVPFVVQAPRITKNPCPPGREMVAGACREAA